jgi:hypothetical protein
MVSIGESLMSIESSRALLTKRLPILVMLEGLVMVSAVGRFFFLLGGLSMPALVWFLIVGTLGGLGLAHFIIRANLLAAKGTLDDETMKPLLAISISMLVLALLISLAGPGIFASFFS